MPSILPLCAHKTPSPSSLHRRPFTFIKNLLKKKTEARSLNGWGWVLDQSLLALQTSLKKSYYILHYIAEHFYRKKVIKYLSTLKDKNFNKSLKYRI